MSRRVFVHIGRNKTGTTALQYALHEGRTALAEAGFVYPYKLPDHGFLAYSLNPRAMAVLPPPQQERMRKLTECLHRDLPHFETDVILSSEGLQNIDPKVLAEWFGNLDVSVIVYLREQAEYIASSYQQEVKARTDTRTFADFITQYVPLYGPFLDSWSKAFGREHLTVRVYDRERLKGGDIVSDFLSIFGIDPAPFIKERPNTNPSITGPLLEAKRRINQLGFGERELLVGTYQVLLDLGNAIEHYRGLVGADPGLVENLREKCGPDNLRVAQSYLGTTDLFPLRPFPPAMHISEEQIQGAYRAILDRLRPRNLEFATELERRMAAANLLAA